MKRRCWKQLKEPGKQQSHGRFQDTLTLPHFTSIQATLWTIIMTLMEPPTGHTLSFTPLLFTLLPWPQMRLLLRFSAMTIRMPALSCDLIMHLHWYIASSSCVLMLFGHVFVELGTYIQIFVVLWAMEFNYYLYFWLCDCFDLLGL